jgi:dihydropteroate synthase
MGVVNVTPDSFSDGGRFLDPAAAVEHALRLLAEGADLIDLGAESTRPGGGVYGGGATTVAPEEETARLLPVLEALRPLTDRPISVDTRKAAVAEAALAAGADLINDVSALGDPDMAPLLAGAECPIVLMHARGDLATMQRDIAFTDVAREVGADLAASLRRAAAAGIAAERIALDPGIGFGKTAAQNLELLRATPALAALGRPLVIGASRKSFIAAVSPAPAAERLPGSLAAAAWAAAGGAAVLRVHDVAATAQFLRLWRAIAAAGDPAS